MTAVELSGKVALVTGASRGIGYGVAEALVARGDRVCITGRNEDALKEAVEKLGADRVIGVAGKAHDEAHQAVAVERAMEAFGRVDYLVNNAGITVDKTVRKLTVDDWHAVLRINLSGAFYMTKAVLEHMTGNEFGRIVNISSVIGQTGAMGQANYASSKAGLIGFSKSLAQEVARKGVTVNCVAPGFIETEMVAAVPEKALEKIVSKIPVGRLGQADEIARAVQFLVDDRAGYVTGSVISVNGGLDMAS
jgi:acetoacetyl-CoA reductase